MNTSVSRDALSDDAAEIADAAAQLNADEQRELLQFMRAINAASRAARASAWAMLTAAPEPQTRAEIRERHRAVCAYLEQRARQ